MIKKERKLQKPLNYQEPTKTEILLWCGLMIMSCGVALSVLLGRRKRRGKSQRESSRVEKRGP
jgi:hypothetical protein